MRKIILVQSCIRGWLARVKYKRLRRQLMSSVVTLQRYVRGWLVRKIPVNSGKILVDCELNPKRKYVQGSPLPVPCQFSSEVSTPWGNVKMRAIPHHNIKKFYENNLWRCVENDLDNKNWKHEKEEKFNKKVANRPIREESPKNPKKEPERTTQLQALCNDIHCKNRALHKHLMNNRARQKLDEIRKATPSYDELSRSHSSSSSDARVDYETPKNQRSKQITEEDTRRVSSGSDGEAGKYEHRMGKKPHNQVEDFEGPYNFRRLLRPTAHPPTESLRKRIVTRGRLYDLKAM